MICLRVVISKTYVDHGIFKVPQNMQFIFEMLNLVVMLATFVLNISVCVITPMEQAIPSENWLQDNSGIPVAILGINIAQALVLIPIIANSIFHWTKGRLLKWLKCKMQVIKKNMPILKALALHTGLQRERPFCRRIQ